MKADLSTKRERTVWHLCSNRWNSAITEYALSSAQALALRGWRSYYSPRQGSPGADRAEALKLEGLQFESFGLSELGSFWKETARIRPDLILLYGGPETFLTRFIRGVPRVRFRGQDSDAHKKLSGWSTRLGMSHCRAILTPAALLEKRFEGLMGGKAVHKVTLGLDQERFAFDEKALQGSQRPLLRILGRLDPVKGHQAFFKVFKAMLMLWPQDVSVSAPFLEVNGLAANCSIEDVKGWGRDAGLIEGRDWRLVSEKVQDLRALLSSTHLGVIPSLGSEIICRVAEEFLLAGCPIAVSGVGALEESLFDENAGFSWKGMSEREKAVHLNAWLLRSFREEPERKKARAKKAAELFSLEAMGARLELILSPYLQS